MAQKSFLIGMHPFFPCGHLFWTILGHFSHAIPQTPILIDVHAFLRNDYSVTEVQY